ncbi:MAG: family transposase [Streptosporangiaceae bacterium]|nr:family transposase [Streptosporangiaceae bacterium]
MAGAKAAHLEYAETGDRIQLLACAIVLGARSVLEAEWLQQHWRQIFPQPVSDSTLRRTLEAIDGPCLARVERARAWIRRVVWTWLVLRGWYGIDLDATIVACSSRKEKAAGTFKGSYGHHLLGGVGGQHPRVRRDAAAAGQRRGERRRRPQDGPGSRPGAAAAAAVVEAADQDRRRGLQPRPARPPSVVDHESPSGAMGDRLGHPHRRRVGYRPPAHLRVGVRSAPGRQPHEISGPDGERLS